MDALVKVALVGTAKARASDTARACELAGEVVAARKEDDPARGLLIAAGAECVGQRSGYVPAQGVARLEAAPADTQPACTEELSRLLRHAREQKRVTILAEFLAAMAEAGLRLPPQLLPELLSVEDARLREQLLPVLGERGRWLARLRDEWRWVAKGSAATDPVDLPTLQQTWQEGTPNERREALVRLRTVDPALARQWLADALDAEKADVRAALLGAVDTGLTSDDESLLESRLDDRSDTVRRIAARLLAHLPDSQLARRMRERALAMLALETTGLIRKVQKLECTPPEEIDKSWERDGISKKPPQSVGKRAHWVQSVFALVPPDAFSEHFGLPPATLITAVSEDAFSEAVLNGWTTAALEFNAADHPPSVAWRQALTEHYLGRPEKPRPGPAPRSPLPMLIAGLPAAEQDRLAVKCLDSMNDAERIALCEALAKPWSVAFGRAYLRQAERAITKSVEAEAWMWVFTMELAAEALPRELVIEAIDAADKMLRDSASGAAASRFQSLADTIALRQHFFSLLAATQNT